MTNYLKGIGDASQRINEINTFISELEVYINYHNNLRTSDELKGLTLVSYKN